MIPNLPCLGLQGIVVTYFSDLKFQHNIKIHTKTAFAYIKEFAYISLIVFLHSPLKKTI